jgi:hypothetical protein
MPLCDSSKTYTRAVWAKPSPPILRLISSQAIPEVSRLKFLDVPWGLRPRRTEQKLALSLLSMLPSAHVNRVGVRIVSFRGSMATPPILYLRFAGYLAVAAQDSRPSDSLLLSCKALSTQNPVYGPPNGCDELRGGGFRTILEIVGAAGGDQVKYDEPPASQGRAQKTALIGAKEAARLVELYLPSHADRAPNHLRLHAQSVRAVFRVTRPQLSRCHKRIHFSNLAVEIGLSGN